MRLETGPKEQKRLSKTPLDEWIEQGCCAGNVRIDYGDNCLHSAQLLNRSDLAEE